MLQNKLLVSVVLLTIPCLIMTKPYLVVTITYNRPAKLVLIKPYGLRNSGDFFIPRYNTTTYRRHSLRYVGPVIWSKLSKKVKNAESIYGFKKENSQGRS